MDNIISEIEYQDALLTEGIRALGFALESIEAESIPADDDLHAVVFCRRLPAYLAVLQVIARDLASRECAIQEAINMAYKEKRVR